MRAVVALVTDAIVLPAEIPGPLMNSPTSAGTKLGAEDVTVLEPFVTLALLTTAFT